MALKFKNGVSPRVLLIGKSGRVHVAALALSMSASKPEIYALSEVLNPGLDQLCKKVELGRTEDIEHVTKYAKEVMPDFAFIGPEEPLEAGVVDKLLEMGIPCVGPTKAAAQIESSKEFAREILANYAPRYNPSYKSFENDLGLLDYLEELSVFAVKPDGLTGGKGVQVSGDHFQSIEEGYNYCLSSFSEDGASVVIEEKLVGEEFSLMSFCDGSTIKHMIPVQDHKRAYEDDTGPNTGGMGSYTCANHLLPFLSKETVEEAGRVNETVFNAIQTELGEKYIGILYGGFMITANGLKVIEYNARFGDPEIMNLLSILRNDFVELCVAMVNGTLDKINVEFENKSTVCKYVVPKGYPDNPRRRDILDQKSVAASGDNLRSYYGAVHINDDGKYELTGSRALAFVGISENISDAEEIANNAAANVKGEVHFRSDIGKQELLQKRIDNMADILSGKPRFGRVA